MCLIVTLISCVKYYQQIGLLLWNKSTIFIIPDDWLVLVYNANFNGVLCMTREKRSKYSKLNISLKYFLPMNLRDSIIHIPPFPPKIVKEEEISHSACDIIMCWLEYILFYFYFLSLVAAFASSSSSPSSSFFRTKFHNVFSFLIIIKTPLS